MPPTDPDLCLAGLHLGGPGLLVLLAVILLLFGRRLPDLMRSLGTSVREFRNGMKDELPPPSAKPPRS